MARRVFYSFHYQPDNWRASQVRNMGVIEGNRACSDNDWEKITQGGDARIGRWIAEQMSGKSCVVVLVGARTAGRKWIDYEIEKGWNDGKGLVGVHVHNLQDRLKRQTAKGTNPFTGFTLNASRRRLSNIVKVYDPPYRDSQSVYRYISRNLEDWVEEAIDIRARA